MSEQAALTTPVATDKVAPVALMSDSQMATAVSNKFFQEVQNALQNPKDGGMWTGGENTADNDLAALKDDPQRDVVLNTIADRIQNHDPVLGTIVGAVERDEKGEITGFTFSDPAIVATYDQSLNTAMATGKTLQEAKASLETPADFFSSTQLTGQMETPVDGNLKK